MKIKSFLVPIPVGEDGNFIQDFEVVSASEAEAVVVAAREMLAFIEMKIAHEGCMNVEQIQNELKMTVPKIAYVETAHHIGCSKTTRRVNLTAAREALENITAKTKTTPSPVS